MKQNIIDFYDQFVERQQKTSINDRIIKLYKRTLSLGLKTHSNVLELGCGIGTMTFLLSKTVTKGRIEAVDISGKSIEFSKKKIKKPNVSFFEDDVVTHIPQIANIDFITLFDVIEHIPIEKHNELFGNISSICNEHTKILINIPNPHYIEYDMVYHPEALQIVDQPLPLKFILNNIENNDLEIFHFETYSIWVENDYQFFVLKKKGEFHEIKLKRRYFTKIINRLRLMFFKIMYDYT